MPEALQAQESGLAAGRVTGQSMKTLVAIPHYGTKNDRYFEAVLQAFRRMPCEISIVVLSNVDRTLPPAVEVRIGTPSKNPRSLPFAHRQLFRDNLEKYDFFVYIEDDTLLTWAAYEAFLDGLQVLPTSEIPGFLRTEKGPDGGIFYSTCHGAFRWDPASVRTRGKHLWARYTNAHAACFIASRSQLRQAIESRGFGTDPHEGQYDMLETAATDFYTRCGFEKLICIDRLAEFSLPHLPNAYLGRLGTPATEVQWQIDALRRIHTGELPSCELFQPETNLPNRTGSKRCREEPDATLSAMLEASMKRILVWGSGDGSFEATLQGGDRHVSVYPLNSVMGECCRHRGLNVFPVDRRSAFGGEVFDGVVLRDVLHLVEDAGVIIERVRAAMAPGGRIVIRVPNFHSASMLKRRWTDRRFGEPMTREWIGATPFTPGSLKRVVVESGFADVEIKADVPARFRTANAVSLGHLSQWWSGGIYLRARRA